MQDDGTDYILRPRTVANMNGVHISTLYRWVQNGEFPAPVRIGRNTSGWWASTVRNWQQKLKRQQNDAAPHKASHAAV